jgi:parallel beta-helix repeat protein
MKNMKGRSVTMRKNHRLRASVFAILLIFFLLPAAAQATDVTVVCPGQSINAALSVIGTGPGTITVTGICTENVSINDARSITIVAPSPGGASVAGGATIVGPLDSDAFDIFRSQGIFLRNLEIRGTFSTTGNGGGSGVSIFDASEAHIIGCNIHDNQIVGVEAFTNSVVNLRDTIIQSNTPNDGLDLFDNSTADVGTTTIQNNGDPVAGTVGVFVSRNSVVVFGGQTNLVQNNANIGIQARNLSNVVLAGGGTTIQGHLTNGILIEEGSHLQVNSTGTLIQGNGAACPLDPTCGGILVAADSTADLSGVGTITGNQGSGISVQQSANVRLSGATVSNNTGDGVHIQWLSIGNFLSGNTITGNGGASVFCSGRSLALGDLSAFSNVKCEETEQSNGHGHGEEDKARHR